MLGDREVSDLTDEGAPDPLGGTVVPLFMGHGKNNTTAQYCQNYQIHLGNDEPDSASEYSCSIFWWTVQVTFDIYDMLLHRALQTQYIQFKDTRNDLHADWILGFLDHAHLGGGGLGHPLRYRMLAQLLDHAYSFSSPLPAHNSSIW